VNINEQMNQLGQIGSVGYKPTDEVVDQLVGRAKRARAIRQGSAALVGSIGAIGLGLIGAQVIVNISHQEDAGIADRNFNFQNMSFDDLNGKGYTGQGTSQDELAKAWQDLKAAAAVTVVAPAPAAPAAEPGTTTTKPPTQPAPPPPAIPAGSFLFKGRVFKCEMWHDAATGSDFWGAWSGTGWDYENKMIVCDPNKSEDLGYKYMGNGAGNTSTRTCTGSSDTNWGAPHQISCRTTSALWSLLPTDWNSASGGNTKWTLNNDAGKILTNSNYKWFTPGGCAAIPLSASIQLRILPQCHEAGCDGWYYHKDSHPVWDGDTYSWESGAWVKDTPPPPPPPEPEPEPEP